MKQGSDATGGFSGKSSPLCHESEAYGRPGWRTTLAAGWEHTLWSGSGLIKVDTNYSKNMTHYPQLNQLGARLRGVAWRMDRADGDLMPVVKQTSGPDWRNWITAPRSWTQQSPKFWRNSTPSGTM